MSLRRLGAGTAARGRQDRRVDSRKSQLLEPTQMMPTTLVDWTRLYRACGLRRTEEYPGRILINLQIRKKITFEV